MFLKPGEIILQLKNKKYLLPSMKGADFGCGSGYFTALLAKEVGPSGIIYAIDVDEETLKSAQEFIDQLDLKNVKFLLQDLEVGSGLEPNSVDFVFIAQVLYQADKPENIIHSAKESLKPGGYLIILEPQKNNFLFLGQKIYEPQEITQMIEKENLRILDINQTQDYYLLVAQNE